MFYFAMKSVDVSGFTVENLMDNTSSSKPSKKQNKSNHKPCIFIHGASMAHGSQATATKYDESGGEELGMKSWVVESTTIDITISLFNIAMENPFLIGNPSINGSFPMAMLNNQRVMWLEQ